MCSQVDEIYVNTIREYGLYDQIWQAFAVFLPVRSVGVQVRYTHAFATALARDVSCQLPSLLQELAKPLFAGPDPASIDQRVRAAELICLTW